MTNIRHFIIVFNYVKIPLGEIMKYIKKIIGPLSAFVVASLLLLLIFYLAGVFSNTIFLSDLYAEHRPLLLQMQ